jgi:Tfp pilus assembly protein PilF
MRKVFIWYVVVVNCLWLVAWLPMSTDPFGWGKNWLLLATLVVGWCLWAVTNLTGESKLRMNKYAVWLVGWLALVGISWWFLPGLGVRNRSFFVPGGAGTLVGLAMWFWLWLQGGNSLRRKQVWGLTVVAIVVGLLGIGVFMLPEKSLPIVWPKENPVLAINQGWSILGSLVAEVVLLIIMAVWWLRRLVNKLKAGGGYMLEAIIMAMLVLGLGVSAFRVVKLGLVILDLNSSWVIALEAIKRNPWLGVGVGNYVQAFNTFRPASFNLGVNWATVFSGAVAGVLQWWTEMGLAGLTLMGILVTMAMRSKNWGVIGAVAMLCLLPVNQMIMFLALIILFWSTETTKGEVKVAVGEKGVNIGPVLVALVVLGVSVFLGYNLSKGLLAEIKMRESMLAMAKNDGIKTYNAQVEAINLNPNDADYRRVYSQTNLALAKNILSKQGLTDEDKQRASTLVEQAVREAKVAVTLDNLNSVNWSNLAVIYRELVGLVEGAADWSYQAYTQAVALDPVNPNLRLNFGGLLYAANRFEEADRVFERVVVDKSDLANGWYNWAYSAKNLNKLSEAVARLSQALILVPVDSADRDRAQKELEAWKKELEILNQKQGGPSGQDVQPTPVPTVVLKTAEPLPTVSEENKVEVPSGTLEPPAN